VGLIAEVDCTAEAKSLCDTNGVSGFPTLMYGDPSSLESYEGSRSYDDLSKFAKENLKPLCAPDKIEFCDDGKKELIKRYQNLEADEIKARINEEEKKIRAAKREFDKEVERLSKEYERLAKEKDAKIAAIQSSDLKLLKSIAKAKSKSGEAAKEEL
jgi:GTP-dependent phosphoenolpyruvate carboxykinase